MVKGRKGIKQYNVKVLHWDNYSYPPIVEYSSQYVNILIFLHYLAILLLYLKSKQEIFLLEVRPITRPI